MDKMYLELIEDLRQQHNTNVQQIHGKKLDNFNKYRYYGTDDVAKEENECWRPCIFKMLIFISSIMLFSFYIYGGQDVKKGAQMAFFEMKTQIIKLENEEPAVKEAMGYVRKAYDEVEDFTDTYMNIGN